MLTVSHLTQSTRLLRRCPTACSSIHFNTTVLFAHGSVAYRRASYVTYTMTASIIDGTAIAKKIKCQISNVIQEKQSANPAFKPSLVIIQVGSRPDSSTYVRMKKKAADEVKNRVEHLMYFRAKLEQVKISCVINSYDEHVREQELLDKIFHLNNDDSVHGILVQLPLPDHISEHAVTSAVSDEKDVDGFGVSNIGELAKRGGKPRFIPCTPRGVMRLLRESGVNLLGKHAVVLGRSDIVGGPLSLLLRNADATVTTCHSRTENIPNYIKQADVLIAAIGKPGYVKGEWLKKGAVVIDVGTNYLPDDTKKSGQRLVGDVDFASAAGNAALISPVPGGVGPMTVTMLLQNVLDSAIAFFKK